MSKITIKQLRSLIKEVTLNESIATDEVEQKKKVVDALIALYYRHELIPSEIVVELASAA